MNDSELEIFRRALVAKRTDLLAASAGGAAARQVVTLDQQSVGRVSRVDAMQQQAMAQAQERQRANALVRIEGAMERIEAGDFGYCTECGGDIAPKRLQVDPSVMTCISCARQA